MGQSDGFKIKVLPRTSKEQPQWARGFLIAGVVCLLAFGALTLTSPPEPATKKPIAKNSGHIDDSVTKYLHEAELRTQMMRQAAEVGNAGIEPLKADLNSVPAGGLPEDRTYGVQLDSGSRAERMYEELNDGKAPPMEMLPGDRINSRLANRRWLNETEHREKVEFVSNFIRAAYERGYEVELDENLVVVGVKRVDPNKKVNIDQVISRLSARQGF